MPPIALMRKRVDVRGMAKALPERWTRSFVLLANPRNDRCLKKDSEAELIPRPAMKNCAKRNS